MIFVDHLYFLAGVFTFLILWLPLFILNKEGRKWMLYMSLFGLIMGFPFVQHMYVSDWWHPAFIFDYSIKIEDLIFGFTLVGSISSMYSLFKSKDKKLVQRKISRIYKIIIIIFTFGFMFSLFYVFGVSLFWTSIIGLSLGTFVIFIKKPTFLKYALITGILISIIIFPGYLFGIYLDPNFIQDQWFVDKLSGITLLSIPIEEFIFYIFASLGISALQEGLES